jgi:hypothetical protein
MKTLITLLLSATLVFPFAVEATNKDKIHPYIVKSYNVKKAPASKYKQQKIAKQLQKDVAKGKKVCKNAVDRKTKQNVFICEGG